MTHRAAGPHGRPRRFRTPARRTFAATSLLTLALTTAPATGAQSLGVDGPRGCVPFGTAQLPPGLPSSGGRIGLDRLPAYDGDRAPSRVDLRTPSTQFNRFYKFALADGAMLARPRESGEPWRIVPTPDCLRGHIVGLSVDDDEMVAVDESGWMYTMDNATHDPIAWNWTSGWGAPLWAGAGQKVPGSRAAQAEGGTALADRLARNSWSLSIASPWDNKTYADLAGREHPVGMAKMTMVPALTGDGSRITYADPWLPNDDSYEIGGPLDGRFRSVALSASGSTSFVVNRYGDMYTRTFDFDSSGSDSVFFRYSWEDQSGKPSADNLFAELLDRNTAAVQLPAPDWTRQPKIDGEITSAITIASTGQGPNARELRVEGSRDGETGFWHKMLTDPGWQFTATGAAPLGDRLENSLEDRSADTLAPPSPWSFTAPLPSRNAAIDSDTLIDIGLPYSVVDPRALDAAGPGAAPSGYELVVDAFDPAATTRPATVSTPGGASIPVLLHSADGMRMLPRAAGLDAEPRHLVGAIEIPQKAFDSRAADPELAAFVNSWTKGKRIAPITMSATDHDLVVR
ncbi:hypothetical protein [Dietzia sp.]|uniref:hypothetical protein n=1 Tax=Dietzia sp. TaxID=1871616 RepID=UPI002FDA0D09